MNSSRTHFSSGTKRSSGRGAKPIACDLRPRLLSSSASSSRSVFLSGECRMHSLLHRGPTPASMRPLSSVVTSAGPDRGDEMREVSPFEGEEEEEQESLVGNGSDGTKDRMRHSSSSHATDKIDVLMTVLLFLSPALGGTCFGYDIGATSGALISMTSPELSGTDWFALSSLQSGLVVSLSLAGALVGSFAALVFGDGIGRKKELITASALYGTGAAMIYFSPGYSVVLIGRLLYGIGIGFAMHAAPAYIAETAPPRIRGLLISLKEAFIVLGILLGYLVSYLCSDTVAGWRIDYGLAGILAAFLGIGMAYLPESPRWLLLSNAGKNAAAEALRKAKGSAATEEAIQREIEEIEATIEPETDGSTVGHKKIVETKEWWKLDVSEVLKPKYRKPLMVGISLMLFQQITGQPSVLYYAASIFENAGFASATAATAISVGLGGFKVLTTGIAVAKVDSWGRRPLLLYGVGAIVASLILLGGIQSGMVPLPAGLSSWGAVVALLTYVGAYQLSFGPVSWLIVGEVFPLRVRGQAIALATLTNFASNFGVSLLLPTLQEKFGPSIYFVFALIGLVALASINATVPETKGKSLEEIERIWQ